MTYKWPVTIDNLHILTTFPPPQLVTPLCTAVVHPIHHPNATLLLLTCPTFVVQVQYLYTLLGASHLAAQSSSPPQLAPSALSPTAHPSALSQAIIPVPKAAPSSPQGASAPQPTSAPVLWDGQLHYQPGPDQLLQAPLAASLPPHGSGEIPLAHLNGPLSASSLSTHLVPDFVPTLMAGGQGARLASRPGKPAGSMGSPGSLDSQADSPVPQQQHWMVPNVSMCPDEDAPMPQAGPTRRWRHFVAPPDTPPTPYIPSLTAVPQLAQPAPSSLACETHASPMQAPSAWASPLNLAGLTNTDDLPDVDTPDQVDRIKRQYMRQMDR